MDQRALMATWKVQKLPTLQPVVWVLERVTQVCRRLLSRQMGLRCDFSKGWHGQIQIRIEHISGRIHGSVPKTWNRIWISGKTLHLGFYLISLHASYTPVLCPQPWIHIAYCFPLLRVFSDFMNDRPASWRNISDWKTGMTALPLWMVSDWLVVKCLLCI